MLIKFCRKYKSSYLCSVKNKNLAIRSLKYCLTIQNFCNMKQINMFTANLSGKALISAKSETKKAVNESLKDFAKSIEAEFTKVIKSEDKRARDCANAAKGKYQTALNVVTNCYPYQTKDGIICAKGKNESGEKIWKEKKLTATAARSIVRDALKNFTDFVGEPQIKIVIVGGVIE